MPTARPVRNLPAGQAAVAVAVAVAVAGQSQ